MSEHAERLASLRWWAELVAAPFVATPFVVDEGDAVDAVDAVADADGADDPPLAGDPTTAQGFFVHPGRGCETATFGFLRRTAATGAPADWYWQCSCKTQYASAVSDAHLIACHTALVRLLDHAATLGIAVAVYDETHYWESRDVSRLVSEVHTMNQLVARVAGRLSDALGSTGDLQAPIFEHPRFERLEMGEDE